LNFNTITGTSESIFLGAIALLALYAIAVLYGKRHAGPEGVKPAVRLLKFLRGAAALSVALLIFGPMVSYDRSEYEKGGVMLLMDSSASMSFSTEVNGSLFAAKSTDRFSAATAAVKNSRLLEKVGALNQLTLASFSSFIKPAAGFAEIADLAPAGNTDISSALSEIMNRQRLSAAIIISDGQNTSDHDPAQIARFLKVPVFTVGAGSNASLKDIAILNAAYPKTCYLKEKTEITLDLGQIGLDGARTVLTLRENGALRSQTPVTLDRAQNPVKITFEPEKSGLVRFDLEAAAVSGEVTLENNRYPFYMNVTAHKVRILHVESYPRQDFSAMQRLYAQNRDISFVSRFVDSPNPKFKLKKADLNKFDIIVLGNINFTSLPPELEKSIDEAITKNQAAVLFTGGPNFNITNKNILAARFPAEINGEIFYEELPYKPLLTPSGANNQITRLSPVAKIASYMWTDIPELAGINYIDLKDNPKTAFASSDILLETRLGPKSINRFMAAPVLIIKNIVGKKSAAILGNSFWFLKMGQLSSKNSMLYDKFMSNLLLWLYSREDSAAFKIETDRTNYFADDMVYVSITARNQDFSPMINPSFIITLKDESMVKTALKVTPAEVDAGFYEFSFKTERPGQYEIAAEATDEKGKIQTGAAKFITNNSSREFLKLGSNFDLLKEISLKTGGKFYELSGISNLAADLPERGHENIVKAEFKPFESAPVLWLLLALLALEWAIRRFIGFE